MKTKLKNEIGTILLILIPLIYLSFIWKDLKDTVPIHWNFKGEVDRYGDKSILFFIALLLPLSIYLLFYFFQELGPKEKINKMGRKFNTLKFLLTLFMSGLAVMIIHSAHSESFATANFIFILVGLLITVLGNFFKTITPNYFLGIRTPWTLEYESVWKSTHILGGKLWFYGGLIIVITALISNELWSKIGILSVLGIITIIPIIHSYLEAKKLKS